MTDDSESAPYRDDILAALEIIAARAGFRSVSALLDHATRTADSSELGAEGASALLKVRRKLGFEA